MSSIDRLRSSAAAALPLVSLSAVDYRAATWSCRAERPPSATCLSSGEEYMRSLSCCFVLVRFRSSAAAVPLPVCLSAVIFDNHVVVFRRDRRLPSPRVCRPPLVHVGVSCCCSVARHVLVVSTAVDRHRDVAAAVRHHSPRAHCRCESTWVYAGFFYRRPPRVRLLLWSDAVRHFVPAAADRVRGDFRCCLTSRATWSPADTGRRLSSSRVVAVRSRLPPVYRQDVATVSVALTRLNPFRQTSPCR